MHDRRHGIPECNFSTFVNEYGDSWALRSQLYWIRDYDGSIPLDFIARYERLEIDVSDILQRLGFDDVALPHLLNSGADGASVKNAGRDYRVVYDATTRAAIAERYCEEIELFGYNF